MEDDPRIRAFVADALQASGYDVIEASHPSEALALSRRHPGGIRLLITDLVMPELNGQQLAELLRSSQPAMKVLFMSGYAEASILAAGLEDVRGRLLPKPFTLDDLLGRVEQALAGGERA